MKVVGRSENVVAIQLDDTELTIINNALNEIANGVHIDDWELQTRMGYDRPRIKALLSEIHALLDKR